MFRLNDVTPATTMLDPRKFGPPESPKQVPPVDALFERSIEYSPTDGELSFTRCGSATIRTRFAVSFFGPIS